MWIAFVILITASGITFTNSNVPYDTEADCNAANAQVEQKVLKVAKPPEGVVAYKFMCVKADKTTFKAPGLDA
jgi:hypothetical protein